MYQVNTKQTKADVAKLMEKNTAWHITNIIPSRSSQSTEQEQWVRYNQNATSFLSNTVPLKLSFAQAPWLCCSPPKSPTVTLNPKLTLISVTRTPSS